MANNKKKLRKLKFLAILVKNNNENVRTCIRHYCRSCGGNAPLGRKMSAGGCRVSPGAALQTSGSPMVLPAGLGHGWWNRAGIGGPRPGYIWAAVP